MMGKRVFTLIELLVVIMIIAILAALLLPATWKALLQARAISCDSNQKQLGLSFQLYSMDFRGYLPGYVRDDVMAHGGVNWTWYLWEYYNDARILECPESPDEAPESDHRSLHLYDGNYGWNYDGTQGGRGKLNKLVPHPSTGYLLFDSGDQCVTYAGNTWANLLEELDLDWKSGLEGCNRHSDKIHACFVDGHVSARALEPFLAVPNASYTAPWFIEWTGGRLQGGTIPYPARD